MKNDTKKGGTSPKGRRKLNFVEKKEKLPLNGKSIFVDVKEKSQCRSIKEDIKRLGARADEFFHKDINYIITSNHTSKPDKREPFQSPESPSNVSTPSPFNCGPSPSPASGSIPPPESVTRGKAIAKRAVTKETNPVLTNAENWGIKIVTLDVALKWIQREISKLPPVNNNIKTKGSNLRGSYKVKKLKSPYLKVESTTRQYRVVHQQVDLWPHANVETPRGTCPFDGTSLGGERSREERGDRIGLIPLEPARTPNTKSKHKESTKTQESSKSSHKKQRLNSSIVGGVRIVTAGELRRRKELKRLQEKKKGYCECCETKYDNLIKHVTEEQHKEFIREKKHYHALDYLINSGPNEATFLQRVLQQHCSIVSGSRSREGKCRKETAVKSTPRNLQNSSKKTTIKIVNSEVQRRSSRSPKEIWLKASENDQSKLLKDNMEEEIRKNRQARRSAEIDMQLEKHYVPARTRNFLFIQGSPSQVCETKVLGKSDVKSTCSHKKTKEFDIDSEQSVKAQMENEGSVCVKDLKNNAEKNLEQSSHCFMHLNSLPKNEKAVNNISFKKDHLLTTHPEKTCKSPLKIEASVEQSHVLQCSLRKRPFLSEKSSEEKSTETQINEEECVLERRVGNVKKTDVFEKKKSLNNEKVLVKKSPRRSSRFQLANSGGRPDEETGEKAETSEKMAIEENLNNRVSEDTMLTGSANSKQPTDIQKKVRMDEQNLHQSNKRKIGFQKTKKDEVDEKEIEESSIKHTEVEIVNAVQEKGKIGDMTTPDAQNSDQICKLQETNEETRQDVVKYSKRLRKSIRCISDKDLQDKCDLKKLAQNRREDADIKEDIMILRRESSVKRKSSGKTEKDFTCDEVEEQLIEINETSLASDKDFIREEESKYEQKNPLKTIDLELKNVNHSSQLPSKIFNSENREHIANEKCESQNICATMKISLTVEIPKDKDNTIEADVEKSLCYIDRVHRLRSTNQRQSIVDRELKDITTKVQERNSCSNSSLVWDAKGQNRLSASPSCYSSPKKTSTPKKNLVLNKVEQTTPIVASPKSGLSVTPRSNKRKRWNKRRNSKCMEENFSTSKPRKLEKLKYPTASKKTPEKLPDSDKESEKDSQSIESVLSDGDHSKQISHKNQSNLKRQSRYQAVEKDTSKDNSKSLVRTPKSKSPLRLSKCVTPRGLSSPLVWKNAKGSTPKGKKRIRLNGSWSVLSDRSVNKLLHDSDSESNFEGFEKGDLTRHSSLCSDASFVEINEVELEENSDHEWEIEQEKAEENVPENDVINVLPEIFSSPGKRSDSSWDTGFVDFIDTQFSNRQMSFRTKAASQEEESLAKPLGSPLRRKRLQSIPESLTENQLHRTKKRRKLDDGDEFQCFMISDKAAQIDEDIQFNFSSPNKRKTKELKDKIRNRQRKSLDYRSSVECMDVKQKKQKNLVNSDRKEKFRKQDGIKHQDLEKNPSPLKSNSGRNMDHIDVTKKEDNTAGTDIHSEKDLSTENNQRSKNFKRRKKQSTDIRCLSPKNQRDAIHSSSPGINCSMKNLRSRKN